MVGSAPNDAEEDGNVPKGRRVHTLNENICLQMCDTTRHCMPVHLRNLFSHFDLGAMTNSEILFQLVYLMAIESGLGECSSYERCAPQLHQDKYFISAYFDAHNACCLSKQKPKYKCEATSTVFSMLLQNAIIKEHEQSNREEDVINFKMTGIVTGESIIITVTPLQKSLPLEGHPSQSVHLNILRYIVGVPQSKVYPLQQHFNKIPELTEQLRLQIFLPLQQYCMPLFGIALFPSLTGLPSEVYDNIFHYLSPNQLRILANVNKRLNHLVVNSKHYVKQPTPKLRILFPILKPN